MGDQQQAERLTREAGLALIEDANRWQRAYDKARDELAAVTAERDRLREALEWISLTRVDDADAPYAVTRLVDKAYAALAAVRPGEQGEKQT